MPQMAPLNWLALAIVFSLVFLIFNIMNYFSFSYGTKDVKTTKKEIVTSWKW
uniref:ATP synthase complex subunit 8 n=1 Tax=Agrianome spinicollis TaxID=2546583 RepID=A0A6H0N4T8_9CUCU|nr:ATP synthase F0 subunit 8 [Agrianome spinicollis]